MKPEQSRTEVAEPSNQQTPHRPHAATSKVILLVDDNDADIFLAKRALRKCGITNPVVTAHDGVAALDYLFGTGVHAGRDPHDLPGVVLLDLKMPRLDGLTTLLRIRADERTRHLWPATIIFPQ